MAARLDPTQSSAIEMSVGVTLTDTGAEHTVFVRRGVIEWSGERPTEADLRIALSRETWLEIAGRGMTWLEGEKAGWVKAEPSREALARSDRLFDGGMR